jgi:hypothetical protein
MRQQPTASEETAAFWRGFQVPAGIVGQPRFKLFGRNEICFWGEVQYDRGHVQVCWSTSKQILSERWFDRNGVANGPEIERHDNGRVSWQVTWVRGQMHGVARQFDDTARCLVRTRFVRGAGLDIWGSRNELGEIRELVDSVPHGVERWGHPRLPHEENYFVRGRREGVSRRWTGDRLENGYPKFFVDDEEVSAAEYARAARLRPELHKYRREEDARARRLHPGLARAWLPKAVRRAVGTVPAGARGRCQ